MANTKKKNTLKDRSRYGRMILAKNESISEDTRETGLNNNLLMIGAPGTGKTGGYVIPAIQNISGSMIVSDTKGQLEKRFRKELEEKGWNVACLDFVNPERSCGYNPLQYVRRYPDGGVREQDVLTVAKIICPTLDKDEPVWDLCAAGYVAFLISYCLEAEDAADHNMATVCKLRRTFSQKNGNLLFADWVEDHPDSFAAKKYADIMANRPADRMWSSIEGFVSSHLEAFSCREMEKIFSADDCFDINDLGKKKTVLFINQSDTDRALDRVITLFQTQALQTLCAQADANADGRLEVPVKMILDDFASGSTIPDFDKVISVIRSRDISVSLIVQSLTQLETLYNHPTSLTILNNCDHILFLGGQDKETAEYIAYRAMQTPETILMMPRDKAYLIRAGEQARLVDKIKPYSTCTDKTEECEAS